MFARKGATVLINLLGGTAVLGSYAWCLSTYPGESGDFWGGVPDGLRSLYTANMFLAAAGYLAFTYFLLVRVDAAKNGDLRFGFGTMNALYALILVPSALWMPLTFAMLESPSTELWWAIRLTLIAVGIGSLGMLEVLISLRSRPGSPARALAIAGGVFFCLQTAVLDAVVWPAYFPV